MTATIALPEAEQALIGCLLNMPVRDAGHLLASVRDEDLTVPQLCLILDAARALVAADVAPDPVAVLGHLRRVGTDRSFLADRDAGVYLASIFEAAPHLGSHGHYLQIVLEHAWRRRVQQTGTRLLQASSSSSLDDLDLTIAAEIQQLRAWSSRLRSHTGTQATAAPLRAVSA